MPTVSLETATALVRFAFWVGVVTDGLAVVPMVSRRIGARLFGGDPSRDSAEYRFAMGIGAALMAGWTVLLLWGAADPMGRRDLLPLTVFPVIAGIACATALAVRRGVLRRSRVLPLWVHLGLVSALYIGAYALSGPFAR